ncbi:cation:proton antiporter domain-containing protein [Streptomyces sp. DW26H14]|uniref:cation:proton antiporter domain-containing protein n=1 Tax=Streptomyces sp. DW26H14 TaxID=3435395 RepID=UPI00403DC58C
MSATELGPAFFISVVVILVVCRAVGRLLRLAGQPPVVGEMVAGVVLGPSVLGYVAPGAERWLFPADLRPVLYVVGQVGLVVFMFLAGHAFHTDRIRRVLRPALVVSAAGTAVPLALGAGLTLLLGDTGGLFPRGVPLSVSALFVGVTLAITAFPMLARIITERGLTGSRFGSLALAAGALDDAVAWVLLAGVLSLAGGSAHSFLLALGGSAGLVLVLVALTRARRHAERLAEERPPDTVLLATVLLLFLAAWYTDRIGLYAVFGAFSLGVVFPRTPPVARAVEAIAPVGRVVFLPLFFTYSGLNTDIGLLSDPSVLLFGACCVVLAVVGKFGACWLAARAAGERSGVALRVATLMNARGLMQLIAINVGLSAGITTPAMFTVLVLVALITTVMASPLLTLWDRLDRRRGVPPETVRTAVGTGARQP